MPSPRLIELSGLAPEQGLCWVCKAPSGCGPGDSNGQPQSSSLRLFENGQELGPGHCAHADIRRFGEGRFSHWGEWIYLSTSSSALQPDHARYTVLTEPSLGDDPRRAILSAAAAVDIASLSRDECHLWGERVFSAFVPDVKLSEFYRSFFLDREFLRDFERFERQNYRSFDRKFALKELFQVALRQPGAVAECGVFRGGSAYLMAKAIRAEGGHRRLHLFDSFAGLSMPEGADGEYWNAGNLACSLTDVKINLAQFDDLICYHEGWIPSCFSRVGDEKFCFLHVDVDLFQPTRDALEFFYPRMAPRGLIVCDDYGFATCPGARKAIDDFFASLPEPVVHLPTGQGIVLIEGRP